MSHLLFCRTFKCRLSALELSFENDPNRAKEDVKHLIGALENMLQQSSCALRSFEIKSMRLNCDELLELFSLTPSVADLSICVGPEPARIGYFFSKLTRSSELEGTTLLLPSLKNLKIEIFAMPVLDGYTPDPESITAMVESRRNLPLDGNNTIALRGPLAELSNVTLHILSVWRLELMDPPEYSMDGFCSILKKHFQAHIERGLTYTVTSSED